MKKSRKQARSSVPDKRFILIIDPNHLDASYCAMTLQNFGSVTAIARSGREAMEFFSLAKPSLVISELVLPDMSGLDLLQAIHRKYTPAIPIIVLTRFPNQDAEDRCRRAGSFACLNKPMQSAELFHAVQKALEPTPRQNIRITTALDASLNDGVDDGYVITSLSDNGIFVLTLKPKDVETVHTVTFMLNDRVIRTEATVLYVYPAGDDLTEAPGMGMTFENLSALDKDAIQQYINDHVRPAIEPETK
jgi:CheY-like chemotaxis protein